MDIATAKNLVEDLVFRPGWTFEVQSFDHRFENSILLRVTYEAINTNRDKAREGYPDIMDNVADKVIMLTRCHNSTDLYELVLTFVRDIDFHEATETLRCRSTDYAAPFHPHQQDGIARLVERFGGTENDYLRFGMA